MIKTLKKSKKYASIKVHCHQGGDAWWSSPRSTPPSPSPFWRGFRRQSPPPRSAMRTRRSLSHAGSLPRGAMMTAKTGEALPQKSLRSAGAVGKNARATACYAVARFLFLGYLEECAVLAAAHYGGFWHEILEKSKKFASIKLHYHRR